MTIEELEEKYFENQNTYTSEYEILETFSKKDLKEYIFDYERTYLYEKLPYLQMINKSKSQYEELTEMDEYFIETFHHYFSGGETLEMSNDVLNKLQTYYRLKYINKTNNNYQFIDVTKIPIANVIAKYMKLPGNFKKGILCPFHKEKTGSFHINVKGNYFHCFGCGKGGNAINFVAEIQKISTKEAYKQILKLFYN